MLVSFHTDKRPSANVRGSLGRNISNSRIDSRRGHRLGFGKLLARWAGLKPLFCITIFKRPCPALVCRVAAWSTAAGLSINFVLHRVFQLGGQQQLFVAFLLDPIKAAIRFLNLVLSQVKAARTQAVAVLHAFPRMFVFGGGRHVPNNAGHQ